MRILSVVLLIVSYSLISKAEIHSPRPEISILASAEVTAGQAVRLTDLASVEFVKAEDATQVLNLTLLPPQTDGEVKKIKNVEMIKLVRSKIGGLPGVGEQKWTYFIPEEVEIRAKKNVISNQLVQNELTMAIQQRCGDCKVNLHDLKIPQIREAVAFENCEIQTDAVKVGGSFLIPVQCRFGNDNKTYWISGSSKISRLGPVMNRQVSPGERITSKDYRMEEVDVTFAKDALARPEDAEGQLAGRFMQINQALYRSDLRKEIAVARGQLVKAISGNESFEITSQAVAEEQGYVGDTIKIKNPESQKFISGQIVEKGVVRVQ